MRGPTTYFARLAFWNSPVRGKVADCNADLRDRALHFSGFVHGGVTAPLTYVFRICQKMPKYFFEIDVGGVRMDSYGSVWTRMGPYGPWGLPGGFLGPPGALGGPERG